MLGHLSRASTAALHLACGRGGEGEGGGDCGKRRARGGQHGTQTEWMGPKKGHAPPPPRAPSWLPRFPRVGHAGPPCRPPPPPPPPPPRPRSQ
eukprot:scaffold5389_cov76-Isochrysis_galbana.AAC.1